MASLAVWRRSFWREYWRLARRSPRDAGARRTVALLTFLLLYLVAVAAFIYWWLGAAVLLGVAAVMIAGLAIVRSLRRERLCDESDARLQVRDFFVDRARILRALLMRAAAEVCLRQEQMPSGMQSVTRQNQNTALRELQLWEKLEPAEARLMMLPEGAWSEEEFGSILPWCEQLRLLRWVLRVDLELVPLRQFPRTDLQLVAGLEGIPARAMPAHWQVRVERDTALDYVARVFAELRERGLVESDAAAEDWALSMQRGAADLEAGLQTVAELDNDDLGQLAIVAVARERYARYLVERMETGTTTPYEEFAARAG